MAGRPFTIGASTVAPGTRAVIELPITRLYTHGVATMPVQVVNGRRSGARLFVTAAVHGDEINGVEIVRRLLALKLLDKLAGTLVCVPVVNVLGLLNHSRYLPDRRDLNRVFPGGASGSLAARTAHLLLEHVVRQCSHGIDIHTGAAHRDNLPHVRAGLDDAEMVRLATAFGAPLVINRSGNDGTLRAAASAAGVKTLLYEAGEALRFNGDAIVAGVRGVVGVMQSLGMLPGKPRTARSDPIIADETGWVRAPLGGIHRAAVDLGAFVKPRTEIGIIAGPFGERPVPVRAPISGVVIGISRLPLVNEGDAIFHIARIDAAQRVATRIAAFQAALRKPRVDLDEA